MAKKWYIVHTHTGFEDKVKASLEERIKTGNLEDSFGEILVPTEQVVEMVKGVRKTSARKFFPGYLLVNMEMDESTWHLVQGTPRVTGFVGINLSQTGGDRDIYKKIPSLSEDEARKIIGRIEDGASKPKPKIIFEEGDAVRVVDGPFANFQGVVEEVFPEKGRVKVMVSIFGRSTPVELEYIQVSKG
ncbi:transcription termination/antitermination protein NusG [Desulfobulbus oligotrophicus]|jgi:transcriptional antiterminator NusG|uniref:Transcription termination/antitermination protein NusG n=1 Tax=Desulfobulbus oligotrophicus TaxID=1909699 RepID=A0A7T5VD64_9BACT|nr:transcription termination/antitermination protein NusG [Desulfobulbus oligotrophicus]MDY0391109.1 transcription termination/antitermination protein NusG [Desulfobulbus oligotrophicus]QQG65714.1 transcription termination/antitermination protein NusG [Desulfobulbus oligotrophicus]